MTILGLLGVFNFAVLRFDFSYFLSIQTFSHFFKWVGHLEFTVFFKMILHLKTFLPWNGLALDFFWSSLFCLVNSNCKSFVLFTQIFFGYLYTLLLVKNKITHFKQNNRLIRPLKMNPYDLDITLPLSLSLPLSHSISLSLSDTHTLFWRDWI